MRTTHRKRSFTLITLLGAAALALAAAPGCKKKTPSPGGEPTGMTPAPTPTPTPAADAAAKKPPPKPPAPKGPAKLIPRDVLFGNPVKAIARVSPDGKRLAYLAPVNGVRNVWVETLGKKDAKAVSQDKYRGVQNFFWGRRSQRIYYLQDKGGDEKYRVHQVDLPTGKTKILTPAGVKAHVLATRKHLPDRMLVIMNQRDKTLFDVHRVDLRTGQVTLDTKNPGGIVSWVVDFGLKVTAGVRFTADGGRELVLRQGAKWLPIRKWDPYDSASMVGMPKDGKSIYLIEDLGVDKKRLVALDLATKKIQPMFAHPKAEVSGVLVNPDHHGIEAVSYEYLKPGWTGFDPKVKQDLERLRAHSKGNRFAILSRTDDDKRWVVRVSGPQRPAVNHLYDRAAGKFTELFVERPELAKYRLAPMEPRVIPSRDGLQLPLYLTFPVGKARRKLPTVMLVHGGPWGRDRWRYHPIVQLLANRGYLVVQPNFRGSAGFGKKFLNAGNREWGRKMQHDVTDAAKWAIQAGFADPKKIAIMGGSYGGYATLAGVTFTPDLYAAAVDIVGPSNILTLIKAIPPYWKPMMALFRVRVGHEVKDKKMLEARSPLNHAQKIKTPLIIFQGQNDPRVKIQESDQIVKAMRQNKKPVTYIVYPDEGHGVRRPPNSLDLFGRTETFLAKYLGGRAEPLGKIEGSTAQVR